MCAYSSIADLNASFYHASQVYSNLIQKLSNKVLKNCRKLWAQNFDTDMMKCTWLMMKPIIIAKKNLPLFSAPKTFVHLPIKNKLGLKIDQVFRVDIFETLMFFPGFF